MALKIGVAIPCHVDDLRYLPNCLSGVSQLNLKPYAFLVDVNNGDSSLREIRGRLFDALFSAGCDVVLQCSVDFYLLPNMLNYVDANKVATFPFLARRLSDFTMLFFWLMGRGWSGCYSIPKSVWFNQVREKWSGFDNSVLKIVGRKNVIRINHISYFEKKRYSH